MSIPFLIAHTLSTRQALAAPANLTALRTEIAPAWVPDPSGRGTWNLLYSCLFTLLLCVYTAIHLHVPPPNQTKFILWLKKTEWVAIAVFAPEIVVVTALEQWFLARYLMSELNKIAVKSDDEDFKRWYNRPDSHNRFDMVYSHYVVMGGFVADVEDIHNVLTRVTISVHGILYLAKHGHFCQVKRSHIADKSKADILAKGLVCIQVLWVAGQAVERKFAGYPITLLEIHTLVHVVCALFMYGLWAQKPLNVQEPTIISFPEDPDPLAFMLQSSCSIEKGAYSGFKLKLDVPITDPRHNDEYTRGFENGPMGFWHTVEPQCVHLDTSPGLPDILTESVIQDDDQAPVRISTYYYKSTKDHKGLYHHHPMGLPTYVFTPASNDPVICTLYTGQVLYFPEQRMSSRIGPISPTQESFDPKKPDQLKSVGYPDQTISWVYQNKSIAISKEIAVISLTRKDLKRFSSVSAWVSKLEACRKDSAALGTESLYARSQPRSTRGLDFWFSPGPYDTFECVSIRAKNWVGELLDSGAMRVLPALTLLPLAYGCVHFGALGLVFPTRTEKLLWEISCIVLIAVAGGLAVLLLIKAIDKQFTRSWEVGPIILPNTRRWSSSGPILFSCSVACQIMHEIIQTLCGERWTGILKKLGEAFYNLSLVVLALIYCIARVYLIVESFISLRHVPIGVYKTPTGNFMSYIPHL